MAVPFRFELHTSLYLTDEYGEQSGFYVRVIQEDGWLLEPHQTLGARKYYGADFVMQAYLAGRMKYVPYNPLGLPGPRLRRLQEAWEAQKPWQQRQARRRLKIVRAVEAAICAGMNKTIALELIPKRVVDRYGSTWLAEDRAEEEHRYKQREARGLLGFGELPRTIKPIKVPCARTVWAWMARYVSAGHDVLGLMSDDADKGNRKSQLSAEVEKLVSAHIQDHIIDGPLRVSDAYRLLRKTLKALNLKVSRKTFNRRALLAIDRSKTLEKEIGRQQATRRTTLPGHLTEPDQINDHMEMDHAFWSLTVVDDSTGIIMGSPWLTAILDRKSRALAGAHISFLSPSWATSSRAIAHAMMPKDLSGIPGLNSTWAMHGNFEWVTTDRGVDYISNAHHQCSNQMNYDVEALPGFMPWLKPSIERWNGTAKREVLSYREGLAAYNSPDYDASRNARVGYAEFKNNFVKWIVNDYLLGDHDGIGQRKPGPYWEEHAVRGVRAVWDHARLRRSICVPKRRVLQRSRGIELGGYFYQSPEFAEMLKRHGIEGYKFLILYDPYDRGYIELLDDMDGEKRWIVCTSNRPDLTDGVTVYQDELHWDLAKEERKVPTYDDVARIKEAVENDLERVAGVGRRMRDAGVQLRFARYLELGDFLTPVSLAPARVLTKPSVVRGWLNRNGILVPEAQPGLALTPPSDVLQSIANIRDSLAGKPIQLPEDDGGLIALEDLDAALDLRWGELG